MDLSSVRARAIARLGWDEFEAQDVEGHYRIFMRAAAELVEPVSPSAKVDDFWHLHILDTRKYHEDCLRQFGKFIHHNPNVQPEEIVVPSSVDQFLANLGKREDKAEIFADTESCDASCDGDA